MSAVVRILRSKFEPSPAVMQRQDAKALKQREGRKLKQREEKLKRKSHH